MKHNLYYSCIKIIFSILLISFYFEAAYSKEWELFPPNAKLWCKSSDGRIYSISADSLISENNYLFNTKLLDSLTKKCFDSIYYFLQHHQYETFNNFSKIIFNIESQKIINCKNDTFFIKHIINLGDDYTQLININNKTDEIKYTCITAKVDFINNQIDSIKEIFVSSKLYPNKNSTIILSKNHGIRKFFNFYFLLKNDNKHSPELFDIIGYESKDESFGYKPEDIRDSLFKWKIGDIRTIENYDFQFPHNKYVVYLDSVINLKYNGDELQIIFIRFFRDKYGFLVDKGIIVEKYNLKDFNNYFNEHNQIAILDGLKEFNGNHFIFIIDSVNFVKKNGVENYELKLHDLQKRINSTDCQINYCLDCEMNYTFIPGPGLVHITINSVWTSYWDLRGYRQGEKEWGLLDLPVGIEESANHSDNFEIYPNPASEQLIIGNNNYLPGNIVISNLLGEVLLKSEMQSKAITIDISNLPQGLYFLKIGNESKIFIKK
jgi:hypothetical protein